MNDSLQPKNRKWTPVQKDLVILLGLGILCYILSHLLDLFEVVASYVLIHERYELDELITLLSFGTIGLAVFSFRRWREAKTEMTRRLEAERLRRAMEVSRLHAQRLETLGTLAGGLAHEINNPLNGIVNYAQLIHESSQAGTETAEFSEEIMAESARITRVTKALLDFARPGEGESKLVSPMDIIAPVENLIRATMHEDQIAFEVDFSDDLPSLWCEPRQVRQVLLNLLSNARDALNQCYPSYHPHKKVRLSASSVRYSGRSLLRFTVEDLGPGIGPETLGRIFDPFFTTKDRSRATTGKQPKGTGLGLAISHQIAREHGGSLSVESAAGEFTRFHLDLPVDGKPEGKDL